MSRRISNSPPPPPLGLGPTTRTQFPEWNGGHHSALLPARHPSLVTRHRLSNRNTSELEFPVTHTKQSLAQFLIATFRAFMHGLADNFQPRHISLAPTLPAAAGLCAAAAVSTLAGSTERPLVSPEERRATPHCLKTATRKLEIRLTRLYSATSKFLIDNFERPFRMSPISSFKDNRYGERGPFLFFFAQRCARISSLQHRAPSLQLARCGGNSNRHTYEKLELGISRAISPTSIFLIDTKLDFIQGAAFASRLP